MKKFQDSSLWIIDLTYEKHRQKYLVLIIILIERLILIYDETTKE